MYAIKNLQFFLNNHPDINSEQTKVYLDKAKAFCENRHESGINLDEVGLISGMVPNMILPPLLAEAFHREFQDLPEHLDIAIQVGKKMKREAVPV